MKIEHSGWSMGIIAGIILTSFILFTAGSADEIYTPPLDLSFNSPNGYVLWHTPNANQDRNLEMAIQQDGKILLSGYTNDTKQKDILVIRYLSDGTPDPLFGNGGQILYSGGAGKDDYAFGIALDSIENILVTGREHNGQDSDILLLRYKSDGTPDTSFGDNGTITYAGLGSGTDSGRGVIVQSDGKIVVCGEVNVSSHKELAVLRFTSDGTLDADFASNGVFLLDNQGEGDSYGFSLALDQDENILTAGGSATEGKEGICLVRLNNNGTLDKTFGVNGIALWNGFEEGLEYGNWVSITPESKILVTGVETDSSGSFNIVILRYNSDGTIDRAFGDEGAARFGHSGYDYAWGQTSMPDGRIIIAGTSLVNGFESPVLMGFTEEGKPDISFGEDGMISFETIGFGPLYAVNIDNEGKILTCGYITEDEVDLGLYLRINAE